MMRTLEERLAIRPFNRTTRSVAPTEAGSRLFHSLAPLLDGLDSALDDIRTLHERPGGTLRINAPTLGAEVLMRRIVPRFVTRYPEVQLELVTEDRLIDIVAEGFDAGVRLGESVPQDMVAVPFGGDERFIAVAAPAYLAAHGTPATPDDLLRHRCIRFRLASGRIYRWEFERYGQELKFDPPGNLTLDTMPMAVAAALAGLGIAFVWRDAALDALARGALVSVLDDWTPPFAGHYLYYPSRRLLPSGLRALVDLLHEVGRDA